MSEAFAEMLVRRRSSHDMFSRTPSTYEGISKEELDELKTVYFLDDDQVTCSRVDAHKQAFGARTDKTFCVCVCVCACVCTT
jgi:hypothetical protein